MVLGGLLVIISATNSVNEVSFHIFTYVRVVWYLEINLHLVHAWINVTGLTFFGSPVNCLSHVLDSSSLFWLVNIVINTHFMEKELVKFQLNTRFKTSRELPSIATCQ